jgi:hypothetical protein
MLNPWGRRFPDLRGKELTLDEKTWLSMQVINGVSTATELSKKCHLPANIISRWVRAIKSGSKLAISGRPTIVAKEHLPKIQDFINSSKTSIKAAAFEEEVYKYAILTSQDSKNTSESQVRRPSRRTLGRLKNALQIKTGNAELTTNARAIACADIRNAVSMCAAQHLMVPLVSHFLILNMDATQYAVGNNSNRKAKVKYINRPSKGKSLEVVKEKGDSGITCFFIKNYLLISAGGVAADPVYIIADDNMNKEEIDIHEVDGLGNNISPDNKGYVIFCKTRCADLKFYEWFNATVLVQNQMCKFEVLRVV